jgi:hypothetical protein
MRHTRVKKDWIKMYGENMEKPTDEAMRMLVSDLIDMLTALSSLFVVSAELLRSKEGSSHFSDSCRLRTKK